LLKVSVDKGKVDRVFARKESRGNVVKSPRGHVTQGEEKNQMKGVMNDRFIWIKKGRGIVKTTQRKG